MSSRKVIVFGPTGAVGAAAARTAAELGAHVVLAMRDTSKSIRGLTAEQEKSGHFERVTADLTKPDTVRDAVANTGAKHAFIYSSHSPDGMKATVEALKAAGIELVVFLSSFTIRGKLEDIPPSQVIPYVHARVEIDLTEVFGEEGFVAVRPGAFASNNLQYKSGLAKDHVKIFAPETTVDCIAPEDIGAVCGTVLANGPPEDGARKIYLWGPELRSQRECVDVLARALGKNPKIELANKEEAYRMFVEDRGVPAVVAKYVVDRAEKGVSPGKLQVAGYELDEEQLKNVERYSGRKGMRFEEWVEKNKELFIS